MLDKFPVLCDNLSLGGAMTVKDKITLASVGSAMLFVTAMFLFFSGHSIFGLTVLFFTFAVPVKTGIECSKQQGP